MTQAQKSKERVERKRGIFLAMYVVVLLIALGPAAWNWWELQNHSSENTQRKFNASLEFAKTIATIGGGMVLYLNFTVATEGVELAQEKLDRETEKAKTEADLAESRLITDRFSKAIEQLGSEKLAVRLGGIYALERIAHDSDRDHWTIMEVLTSFIQEKTSTNKIPPEEITAMATHLWQESGGNGPEGDYRDDAIRELEPKLMTKDIQAAVTVIGRRLPKDPPDKELDLSGAILTNTNLSSANLSGAKLGNTNFNGANLNDASLNKAYLIGARLIGAHLIGAHLNAAYCNDANLRSANLSGAKLNKANLSNADLSSANFNGADLRSANLRCANLRDADLSGADLRSANLRCANLRDADLSDTNLKNANLSGANVTEKQLQEAKLCQTTLPDGITLDRNRDCQALGIPTNQVQIS
jgi:uncharacterized protein YjbI with pentapeptide repeats